MKEVNIMVTELGLGDKIVVMGTFNEKPAVFIRQAEERNTIGTIVPYQAGDERNSMVSGERVLVFQTQAKAKEVFQALTTESVTKGLNWNASSAPYDRSIHLSVDAQEWADLFLSTFPECGADFDTMTGWFANTMMARHDYDRRAGRWFLLSDLQPTIEDADCEGNLWFCLEKGEKPSRQPWWYCNLISGSVYEKVYWKRTGLVEPSLP